MNIRQANAHPRRAIVTPPRPRAKCSGFYAVLRQGAGRATAGRNDGSKGMFFYAFSCGFMQFFRWSRNLAAIETKKRRLGAFLGSCCDKFGTK